MTAIRTFLLILFAYLVWILFTGDGLVRILTGVLAAYIAAGYVLATLESIWSEEEKSRGN